MFADDRKNPAATARIRGSEKYSTINGRADFYDTYGGTIIMVEVKGIPEEAGNGFHGFHIHQGGSCTGNEEDAFADTGRHYAPQDKPHPEHAGDLPPLLAAPATVSDW